MEGVVSHYGELSLTMGGCLSLWWVVSHYGGLSLTMGGCLSLWGVVSHALTCSSIILSTAYRNIHTCVNTHEFRSICFIVKFPPPSPPHTQMCHLLMSVPLFLTANSWQSTMGRRPMGTLGWTMTCWQRGTRTLRSEEAMTAGCRETTRPTLWSEWVDLWECFDLNNGVTVFWVLYIFICLYIVRTCIYRTLPRLRPRPKLRPPPLLGESSCIG